MACEDRQLTEAQRVAGYQNQRTGVAQAVRPFSGTPSVENLIDYINRELFPAVKATRNKVNDIYLPTVDNAPSGNPLAFYFSTETGNADPTAGRARFDASPQDTATTIRVSESNGRLADVAPWLDVMAGGATSPLGAVTVFDAINPARFIRFDLTAMTDQGTYWDLAVTPIESSHDDPFVDGGAIVLSFIPGVASSGATVPNAGLDDMAQSTIKGRAEGAGTGAPQDLTPTQVVAIIDGESATWTGVHSFTGASHTVDVAGAANITAGAASVIETDAGNLTLRSNVASVTVNGQSDVTIAADDDDVAIISGDTTTISTGGTFRVFNPGGERFEILGSGAFEVAGSAGTAGHPLVTNGSASPPAWQRLGNAGLDDMAQSTIKGRAEGAGTGAPQDLTPTEVVAVIDAESPTWTGSHSFTGATHTVNVSGAASFTAGGDASVSATDDILLNASSGVAIVAGSGATGFPVATVATGDMLIRADDGIAIEAEGTAGVSIAAAGASSFSTSVGNLVLSTSAAGSRVSITGQDDVLVAATDDSVFITSGVATTVTAGTLFRVTTATVERLEIASTGAWQVNNTVGTAGHPLVTNGSASPPAWQQLGTVGIADAAVTLAKQADLAQSRIIGRAEGAGTGVPTSLTPAQVVSIIDGEAATWTGAHSFTSTFRLNGVISPAALSANQNNYNPTGWSTANVVRLSTNDATPREITGAQAGADGELKYLVNVGTGQIALQHENASSTAANRFRFASLTVFALDPEDMVGIWYDPTSDRWRVLHGLLAT